MYPQKLPILHRWEEKERYESFHFQFSLNGGGSCSQFVLDFGRCAQFTTNYKQYSRYGEA